MILTGQEIIKEVEKGRIEINPFKKDQINPNSYNFSLGDKIKYYRNEILDPKIKQDVYEDRIESEGYTIYPGKIYLGHTFEVMGSDYFVPIIRDA